MTCATTWLVVLSVRTNEIGSEPSTSLNPWIERPIFPSQANVITTWPLPAGGAVAAEADARPTPTTDAIMASTATKARTTCFGFMGSDIAVWPLSAPCQECAGEMNGTMRGAHREVQEASTRKGHSGTP